MQLSLHFQPGQTLTKARARASLRGYLRAVTAQKLCPGVPCATRLSLSDQMHIWVDDASKPTPKISARPVRPVPAAL